MSNNIDQLTDDALSSADGAARAAAKPYLFTRLTARMQRREDSRWEKAVRFVSRPAVAIAGLCLVVAINVLVILGNKEDNAATAEEQLAAAEDFPGSMAALYDTENNEP
jgi:hypothetical protein